MEEDEAEYSTTESETAVEAKRECIWPSTPEIECENEEERAERENRRTSLARGSLYRLEQKLAQVTILDNDNNIKFSIQDNGDNIDVPIYDNDDNAEIAVGS